MAQAVNLHDLVAALTNAVVEAQTQIERRQVDLVRQYFDAQGVPLSLDIKVPKQNRDGSASFEQLAVPLLALMPLRPLHISEFRIEFDVELGDLGDTTSGAPVPAAAPVSSPSGARISVPEIAPVPERAPGAPLMDASAQDASSSDGSAAPLARSASVSPLAVGLQGGGADSSANKARISMRVDSLDHPPEGLSRLVQRLNALF